MIAEGRMGVTGTYNIVVHDERILVDDLLGEAGTTKQRRVEHVKREAREGRRVSGRRSVISLKGGGSL